MPPDLARLAPRHETPFRDAKPRFGLLWIGSTTLIVSLAVLLSGQLLLSALPQLCAAIRCCLLRRYIFFAVNFMVLLLVLLKLQSDGEFGKEGAATGARLRELSPDEWFDALSSPTSSFGGIMTGDKEYSSTPASPLEPISVDVDVTAQVGKSGFQLVSFSAPSRNLTTTCNKVISTTGSSTPASFLEPADSSPGGRVSDVEFYSCPPTPSRSPLSSPVPALAVTNVKPSPPAQEADDSMGATWKAVCRRATAALHLKKRSTWDINPLPAEAETAARGLLRKSEVFQEEEPADPMRAVLEIKRLMKKEVAVAKGRDVEDADDSVDATWTAITGGAAAAAAAPHLKKSGTWDAPPSVEAVLSAARAQLKKSETFQEAAAAGARRAVLEKRMKGREVAIVEDCDEMNRRFDTFIKNFNKQLRLQRVASLRRRRHMDMNTFYSA